MRPRGGRRDDLECGHANLIASGRSLSFAGVSWSVMTSKVCALLRLLVWRRRPSDVNFDRHQLITSVRAGHLIDNLIVSSEVGACLIKNAFSRDLEAGAPGETAGL